MFYIEKIIEQIGRLLNLENLGEMYVEILSPSLTTFL